MMKLLPLMIVAAGLSALPDESAASVVPLTWTPCASAVDVPAQVAARTWCAMLMVPRDYANPSGGTVALDVVRVDAAGMNGGLHQGTLLLEPGEFADTPHREIPAMAAAWLTGGDAWRSVSRSLDLVGLAQRRMDDADGHDCVSATSALPRHASLGAMPTGPNFVTAEALARAIATACQNDPMHAHIGASARIKDMDKLREALGESRLHLVGVGRGGWIATRFAERYPDSVGRVLLDSTWDIDGSVVEAMEARVEERGRTIRRNIATVTDAPERFGWGTEPMDIQRRIGALPRWAREAWAGRVANVPDLLAVLAMARLLERDAALTVDGLRAALTTTRLSGSDDDNQAARESAGKLLDEVATGLGTDTYGFGTRAAGSSPAQIASVFATRCNDGSWGTKQRYWRQRTHELRDAWPSSVGNETFQGMVCSTWPAAFGQSEVPVLAPSVSILMAHAEFDDEAPLRHAVLGLHGHVTARMVVARGLRAHGMAIRSDRPCVSEVTGRFLAEGILPANKLTNCAMPDPVSVP